MVGPEEKNQEFTYGSNDEVQRNPQSWTLVLKDCEMFSIYSGFKCSPLSEIGWHQCFMWNLLTVIFP
jgi:hypothetical protein